MKGREWVRFPAVRPELPAQVRWAPFVEEAYKANWFTNFGALSRRLEHELALQWGSEGACAVTAANGTLALAAPLIAAGVTGPVLVPAFTFPATAWAARLAGATPLLIDVDPRSWSVSAAALDAALAESGAAAAIVVCPFGLRRDFSEHEQVAARRGVRLIIDNAAGLGSAPRARAYPEQVFEVFSLHATKPFGIGEGGLIFAHPGWEARLRSALNFGLPSLGMDEDATTAWGVNGKMSELQAAVGLAVAQSFDQRLAKRRAMAACYMEAFAHAKDACYPTEPNDAAWQLFPLLLQDAHSVETLTARAAELGVETRRYYRPALSTLRVLAPLHPCPVAERLAERMICLPVYSTSVEERSEIVGLVSKALLGIQPS